MRILETLISTAACGLIASCASVAPAELVDARSEYHRVSNGPAAQSAPAEVHTAQVALTKAETSFEEDGDNYRTRDLAYVAQRKVAIAETTALIAMDRQHEQMAKDDLVKVQGDLVTETKAQLSRSESALATSKDEQTRTADQLRTESQARKEAEEQASTARDALAKIAAIKDEPRGMVITLSGSVLFASNRSALLPGAVRKIEQVAAVLLTTEERNLTVEGHTDSMGSESHNVELSQQRADAVRDALVRLGYEPDRIVAHGLGEGHPIADNSTSAGRANNRRVEIVIDRETPLTQR
jgi:outer membrane protein OmpA-like peptidoglycan-associated protein